MRRAITSLSVLGCATRARAAGVASATPTVTFKAKAVPISGSPHGEHLRQGRIRIRIQDRGKEYGGFPRR